MTRLRRAAQLAAALAIVPALMGSDGGCMRTNRQPWERQVDPNNQCTAKVEVTEATGPYSIWFSSEDPRGGMDWYVRGEKATGPGWYGEANYTCGEWVLKIEFSIEGHENDVFGCRITDDPKYPGNQVEELAFGSVACTLVIGRAA